MLLVKKKDQCFRGSYCFHQQGYKQGVHENGRLRYWSRLGKVKAWLDQRMRGKGRQSKGFKGWERRGTYIEIS
jgi:hypothetical protein